MTREPVACAFMFACVATCGACSSGASDLDRRFAVEVIEFTSGERAGFGQDQLPDIVLGPPRGAGETAGSTDVLSLGVGGSITVRVGVAAINEDGPDLVIFENAFRVLGGDTVFPEAGEVSVSVDGETFVTFPCDAADTLLSGCAGRSAVYANADTNEIDPFNADEAGGDWFDLEDVGLEAASFVRIVDVSGGTGLGGNNEGFDLDAVGVVHPVLDE